MCIFFWCKHKTDKIKHPDFGKIKVVKHSDAEFDIITENVIGWTWPEYGKIWFVQFAFGNSISGTIDQNTKIATFVDSHKTFERIFTPEQEREVLVSVNFLVNNKLLGNGEYTVDFSPPTYGESNPNAGVYHLPSYEFLMMVPTEPLDDSISQCTIGPPPYNDCDSCLIGV